MKYVKLTLILAIGATLLACGGEHQHKATDDGQQAEAAGYPVTATFKAMLESVLDHYFVLSESLVQADAESAKSYSADFASALEGFVVDELTGSALEFWTDNSTEAIERAKAISELDDIEEQRYQFEYLSEAMINIVREFGPLSFTVYQQRCPMVRDGSADWLSREKGILNPYHGDRMLRCGSIVREI